MATQSRGPKRPRNTRAGTMGRPSKLDSILERDGRRLTLTEAIVEDVRDGLPLDLAIRRTGAHPGTVGDFFRQAARVSERQLLNPRHSITPQEQRLLDFSANVDRARAEGERVTWGQLETLARGGVRRRTTIKYDVANKDADGNPTIVEQTVVEEDLLPNAVATIWKLEHNFGRSIPLDIRVDSGALDDEHRAEAMLDGLEDFLAKKALEPIEVKAIGEGNGNGAA